MINDIQGSVLVGYTGTAVMLLQDADGNPVVPSGVSAVQYSISGVAPDGTQSAVDGHSDVSLTPAAVLFAELQSGPIWSRAGGYNFRHEIDVSTDAAFPTAGVYYLVYTFTPTAGQKIGQRFRIIAS